MRTNQLFAISMVAILAILVACKTQKVQETEKNIIPQGSWVLIKLGDEPVKAADYTRGLPTIVFKDSSSFSGSTGCNQYMATYKHTSENISIKMGPLTKMACPGDADNVFMDAISKTNRADMKEDILTFYENEKSVMTFKRAP